MLRLPEAHRDLFKKPFGTLYGSIDELLARLEGRAVYAVGDVVTHNLLAAGVVPDVAIIDGYTMRLPCTHSPLLQARKLTATNPAGTITDDLVDAIDTAVRDPPVVIVVDGAIGFTALVVANDTTCPVTGDVLPAGADAFLALFPDPSRNVVVSPRAVPGR